MSATVEIDKQQVVRSFNRHAASYDGHAHIQAAMAEGVLERLVADGRQPRSILELGCGTGYLTELLVRTFPGARITAIDLAERMVQAAQTRLASARTLELVVGDVERGCWGDRRFDLVVSSATVQWLAEPQATIGRLGEALEPGGLMLHATFGPRTFQELFSVLDRVEADSGLPPGRRGLPLLSAPQWELLCAAQGLMEIETTSRLVRREYESCRACLAEIKRTGAAATSEGTPRSPVVLSEVMRRYDREHRSAGGVFATYEVLELAARKPLR